MFLNEREIKILEKFYYQKEIKLNTLSKEFNISERMLRYNIDKINLLLKFIKINPIKKSQKGYFIFENNNSKLLDLIKELEPIDKSKRLFIIQLLIAFSKDIINIKYLTEYFEVSRMTINKDINTINKELVKFEVKIINSKYLKFISTKEKLNKFKFFLLNKQIMLINENQENDYINRLKDILFINIFENNYFKIKSLIMELIKELNIKLNDGGYINLLSQLLYMTIGGNVECEYELKQDKLINCYEYSYIKTKIKLFKLSSLFNESDKKKITNLIIYLKSLENKDGYYKEWLNIEVLAKNIITSVQNNLKINLTNDRLLLEFLIQHLNSLIKRINLDYSLDNIEIDREYKVEDDLYHYIKNALNILDNIFEVNINENEIYLLKYHFLASIERISRLETKPKDIIIISHLGQGTNKILIDNIKQHFNVNVLFLGPVYKLKEILKQFPNVKYILSTIDIKESIKNKEIIKIDIILSEKNIQLLKSLGFKRNNNKISLSDLMNIIKNYKKDNDEEKLIKTILKNFGDKIINDRPYLLSKDNILKSENILLDYEVKTIEDAIKKSCTILEKEYINSSYTEEVLKIFKENNNHIIRYNGIILPHTKNKNNVFKSGISIIKLQNPVFIKETNEKIDTVICFVIKDEKILLEYISNIINKVFKNEFKDILANNDKLEIIRYLNEF
ncbi:BglG family transcription antiterminator [Oceanivirga salmonicida]|uniref:BglG family transcription antiterminator n=1 Tax=Oceanivirga salmonicida TaxID=1769291 RepID=UPI0018CC45A4|nr:PTS sugar transporter subunit IIA [Oceanivirga salmonicida]